MDEQRLPPVPQTKRCLRLRQICPPPHPTPSHMLNFPRFGLSVQEAQMLFDRYATPICPSQAALPRTPSVARTNGTAPDT